jgi:hypothetical protein
MSSRWQVKALDLFRAPDEEELNRPGFSGGHFV